MGRDHRRLGFDRADLEALALGLHPHVLETTQVALAQDQPQFDWLTWLLAHGVVRIHESCELELCTAFLVDPGQRRLRGGFQPDRNLLDDVRHNPDNSRMRWGDDGASSSVSPSIGTRN